MVVAFRPAPPSGVSEGLGRFLKWVILGNFVVYFHSFVTISTESFELTTKNLIHDMFLRSLFVHLFKTRFNFTISDKRIKHLIYKHPE